MSSTGIIVGKAREMRGRLPSTHLCVFIWNKPIFGICLFCICGRGKEVWEEDMANC